MIQFGALDDGSCDGCSPIGNPSDRIDILDSRMGDIVVTWATTQLNVTGMDASRGDGVYLATGSVPVAGINFYAVRLNPATGTPSDSWGANSPAELVSLGIGTTSGGSPIVGGDYFDGSNWAQDVFEAAGGTSFTALGVEVSYDTPLVLGATDEWVAYRTGGTIRLASITTGYVVHQVTAPPGMRDGHLTSDGVGVVVAPGDSADAQFVSLLSDDEAPIDYVIPQHECPPVSADAGTDSVYVLTSCGGYDAQVHKFVRATGEYVGVVKTYSAAELDSFGSYPVRLRVYGSADPGPTPIIYVHGINGAASQLVSLLSAPFVNDNEHGAVISFFYWQDKDCSQLGAPTALPEVDGNTNIPIDPRSSADPRSPCDSQSSIGQNAVLLYSKIQEVYAQYHRPVILLGYSMGAAVIRGAISYSEREDGAQVASTMIDTVITIAGAHDGSRVDACALDVAGCEGDANKILRKVGRFLMDQIGFHRDRPAVYDLAAGSDWYHWANFTSLPSTISYYNVYADFAFEVFTCLPWDLSCPTLYSNDNFGDGVLLAGTDYPYDVPDSGSARFSRLNTQDQWEWMVYGPNGNSLSLSLSHLHEVQDYPAFHTRILDGNDDLTVDGCTGETITLTTQMLRVLYAKLGLGPPAMGGIHPCPLHEVTP